MSEKNRPPYHMQDKRSGGTSLQIEPKTRRPETPVPAEQKAEVKSDGQA